jgi:excisionase family DNA binding protein
MSDLTISTGKVAKLLNVSSQSVINWANNGTLEFHRIGKGPRKILITSLLVFIESNQLSPDMFDPVIWDSINPTSESELTNAFNVIELKIMTECGKNSPEMGALSAIRMSLND